MGYTVNVNRRYVEERDIELSLEDITDILTDLKHIEPDHKIKQVMLYGQLEDTSGHKCGVEIEQGAKLKITYVKRGVPFAEAGHVDSKEAFYAYKIRRHLEGLVENEVIDELDETAAIADEQVALDMAVRKKAVDVIAIVLNDGLVKTMTDGMLPDFGEDVLPALVGKVLRNIAEIEDARVQG